MSRQATWIFVTDDPATWPPINADVIVWFGGDEWRKWWRDSGSPRVSGVKAWMPVYVPEEE